MRTAVANRWVVIAAAMVLTAGHAHAQTSGGGTGSTTGGGGAGSGRTGGSGGSGSSGGFADSASSGFNLAGQNAVSTGVGAGSLLNSFQTSGTRRSQSNISTSNPLYATYLNPLAQGMPAGAQQTFGTPIYNVTTGGAGTSTRGGTSSLGGLGGGATTGRPGSGLGATSGLGGSSPGLGTTGGRTGTGGGTASSGLGATTGAFGASSLGTTGGTGARTGTTTGLGTTGLGATSGLGATGSNRGMAGALGTNLGGTAGMSGNRLGTGNTGRMGLGGQSGFGNMGGFAPGSALGAGQTLAMPVYATVVRFETAPMPAAQIRSDLQQVVMRSASLPSRQGIQVGTVGGRIVLRGTVGSVDEKILAENMLRLTPGVGDVQNELTIRNP